MIWSIFIRSIIVFPDEREEMAAAGEKDVVGLLSSGTWVTLSYVEQDKCIFLMSDGHHSRWPAEALRNGEVLLTHEGERVSGSAELVSDQEERNLVMNLFHTKYGEEKFRRWFPEPGRVVKFTPHVVRGLGREAYYTWLESEFDSVAHDYDRHITENSINMLLRERSLARMKDVFKHSKRLLEIGCGSGMETLPLLTGGHEIVVVDISAAMLDVVRSKAAAVGVSDRLIARKLKARDVKSLISEFGAGQFDGCYSTYGALNCEQSLYGIPEALHSLLRDNGKLVVGIYNRFCLSEVVGYGLSLRFERVLNRVKPILREGDSRFCIDVFPYSVHDITRIFQEFFSVDSVIGVPVILPPSDLDVYARKFSGNREKLNALDLWFGKRWPFNMLGDHFLMTLSRRNLP